MAFLFQLTETTFLGYRYRLDNFELDDVLSTNDDLTEETITTPTIEDVTSDFTSGTDYDVN